MTPPEKTPSPQLNNPFDLLPPMLFNVLGSQGGLQRHYIAILLRIYSLAEFNRFGLTRDIVVHEIVTYLASDDAQSLANTALTETPTRRMILSRRGMCRIKPGGFCADW